MVYAILTLLLVLAIYAPQFWVRHTMRKHSTEITDMPGTGGELAHHLVELLELKGVTVETTDEGRDHFDPSGPAVRLSPSIYEGKSLTAVAVATHEVGHAIQYFKNEPVFQLRFKYMPTAMLLRRAGELLLLAVPVVAMFASPMIIPLIALSLGLQLFGAGAYLIMLPEEWDASFNKALPILEQGKYVPETALPAIQSILRAAALTYFASALASIVNLGRWALLLRR